MLEKAFLHHAGGDASIDAKELQRALGLRSEYLAVRVLAAFDTNRDGVIDKAEFLAGVRALVLGSDREKLAFAFRVHDHDGDGTLNSQELLRMIAISLAESDVVERATQSPEALTRVLFKMADRDGDGRISLDELEAVVQKQPELLRKMTRAEATWILPNEDLLAWIDDRKARRSARTAQRFERGLAPWVLMVLWVLANIALFAVVMRRGAVTGENALMDVGRALGRCLDFNGALILLPMARRILTRVRATWVGRVFPVDDAIDIHRLLGHTLFALAVAHSAAFVAVYAEGHAPSPVWHVVETSRGWTGLALLAVFIVMWVFSLSFIRRTSKFELFYFTHLLYVVWFVLAVVHAASFLFWAGVPLLGFLVEQVWRLRRRGPSSTVVSSQALRSGVTRLEIARPTGFAFGPGDYVFLRIPRIARNEWHPFTISSAPERDTLSFHVRSLGNWTGALRRLAETEPDSPDLVTYVDGPYGSPSAPIFASRFAVLIGAGIGVTPFASVLESIVLRANGASERPSRLEKADFFWLNRDQYSFEWFAALLSELEKIDLKGLVDFHLCMTGARTGATSMGLELARAVMHAAGRSDIITGLRTHTHLGSPDWATMLGAIAYRHKPEPVDVFFCGPPGLAAKLRPICQTLGMPFHEERF
jgi:predicted ferric reductase/Ca2+-binding EF-hand superfamily protein